MRLFTHTEADERITLYVYDGDVSVKREILPPPRPDGERKWKMSDRVRVGRNDSYRTLVRKDEHGQEKVVTATAAIGSTAKAHAMLVRAAKAWNIPFDLIADVVGMPKRPGFAVQLRSQTADKRKVAKDDELSIKFAEWRRAQKGAPAKKVAEAIDPAEVLAASF